MPTVGTEKPTVVFWPPSFVGRWVDWGEVGRGFHSTHTPAPPSTIIVGLVRPVVLLVPGWSSGPTDNSRSAVGSGSATADRWRPTPTTRRSRTSCGSWSGPRRSLRRPRACRANLAAARCRRCRSTCTSSIQRLWTTSRSSSSGKASQPLSHGLSSERTALIFRPRPAVFRERVQPLPGRHGHLLRDNRLCLGLLPLCVEPGLRGTGHKGGACHVDRPHWGPLPPSAQVRRPPSG